jgi:surfactin family lipopeptide synthetase C
MAALEVAMPAHTNEPGQRSATTTAQQMKSIWTEVLKIRDLSLDDEFGDLGGDSLAAMLCISRIRDQFNVEFTVEDFFLDHATIADFSKRIDEISKR